jgi:hypothetical protein
MKSKYDIDNDICFWIKEAGKTIKFDSLNNTCKLIYRGGIDNPDSSYV